MKVKIDAANAKRQSRKKLLRQRSFQAAEYYEGTVASLKLDLETYLDVLRKNSQVVMTSFQKLIEHGNRNRRNR